MKCEGTRRLQTFPKRAIRNLLDELASVVGGWRVKSGAPSISRSGLKYFGPNRPQRSRSTEKVDAILKSAVAAKVFRIGLVFPVLSLQAPQTGMR